MPEPTYEELNAAWKTLFNVTEWEDLRAWQHRVIRDARKILAEIGAKKKSAEETPS